MTRMEKLLLLLGLAILACVVAQIMTFGALLSATRDVSNEVRSLSQEVRRMAQEPHVEPGVLYYSYYSAGSPPVLQEITARFRSEGHETETEQEWNDRHDTDVKARKALYPPITGL